MRLFPKFWKKRRLHEHCASGALDVPQERNPIPSLFFAKKLPNCRTGILIFMQVIYLKRQFRQQDAGFFPILLFEIRKNRFASVSLSQPKTKNIASKRNLNSW